MYNQRVIDQTELPIPPSSRKYTDVLCTCTHFAFISILAILALIAYSHNADRSEFPSCSHPLYLLDMVNGDGGSEAGSSMLCVQSCPNNYMMLDGVCFPSQQAQLVVFLDHSPLASRWSQSNLIETLPLFIIFVLSVALSLMAASYLFSRSFQRLLIVLALAALIFIILLMTNTIQTPEFIGLLGQTFPLLPPYISWAMVGVGVFGLLVWIICFHDEISWSGLLIDNGSRILPQKMAFVIFILEYYVKLAGIAAIFTLQHYAFNHSPSLSALLPPPQLTPLNVLNFLEYLWNLQYLKDTLYFSISHQVNAHYFSHQDIDYCTCLTLNYIHGGSLSAGSLLNSLFCIPNSILDILCCYPQDRRQNCLLCCNSLTGLARIDAYAYQSLTAIPYCNSSRQIRRLSSQSVYFKGVNSPLSSLRVFVHIVANIACLSFGIILMKMNHIQVSAWLILILLLISESLMSGLMDTLTSFAQALQSALLIDSALSTPKQCICLQSKVICDQLKQKIRGRPFR